MDLTKVTCVTSAARERRQARPCLDSNLRGRAPIEVDIIRPLRSLSTPKATPMFFVEPMRVTTLLLAASAVLSPGLGAQQTSAAHQSAPVPAAGAVLRSSPVAIDGRIDEEA